MTSIPKQSTLSQALQCLGKGSIVDMPANGSEYGWAKYPTAYGRAMNLSRQMRDQFDAAFERYDVIVMPTCPQPPRRHIPSGLGPLGWADHARTYCRIRG